MLMNWLSLRDSSSLLRFYYIGLRKYPLMWILPKFSVPAVCTDQNSTYKFYFIPKGRISPNWYFLFNCEDLGEWKRWERKAEVILTARDVLFFWNHLSHNAVCYYLHVEDGLSPGRWKRWRNGSPGNHVDTNHKSEALVLCFSCLFSAWSDSNVMIHFLTFVNFY